MAPLDQRRAALALLGVALAWVLGGIATTVHFHGVGHFTDPYSGELVHIHHCDCHGGTAHDAARGLTRDERSPLPRSLDRCLHIGLALHTSSLVVGEIAPHEAPESVAFGPRVPTEHAAHPVALLLLAPKLPPPARG
jgi:hypothetical protein